MKSPFRNRPTADHGGLSATIATAWNGTRRKQRQSGRGRVLITRAESRSRRVRGNSRRRMAVDRLLPQVREVYICQIAAPPSMALPQFRERQAHDPAARCVRRKGCTRSRRRRSRDAGDIDWESVDSLIEFYLQCGVHGLTILGMMGEAQKLSDEESAALTRHYLRRVDGRVPVIVGVSNPGTTNLVKLGKTAMDAGACGVMIAPLDRLKDRVADRRLFRRCDRAPRRQDSGRLPGLPAVDAGRHLGAEAFSRSSTPIQAS